MFENYLSSNQQEKLFNILVELTGGNIGAATEAALKIKTLNGSTEATLLQVRDAIKAQIDIASTLWTDNSGAYYVRRDLVNEGTGAITVTFTLPDGTAATPGAGLKPLSTAEKEVTQEIYDVLTAGTGYSVGDILCKVAVIDALAVTPTITTFWMNLTTSATIAAPTGANVQRANENINSTLLASENFIGAVGGKSKNISLTIPCTAVTYVAGRVIGGVLTLTGAARLSGKETILQSLHLKDLANSKGSFSILIFDSDPSSGGSGGVFTDNGVFAYGTTAYAKQIGLISVSASDWKTFDTKASAPLSGLGRVYTPNGSANLFAVIVAESSIALTANSMSMVAGFLQD
jgi:hypothetical protein